MLQFSVVYRLNDICYFDRFFSGSCPKALRIIIMVTVKFISWKMIMEVGKFHFSAAFYILHLTFYLLILKTNFSKCK